MYLSLSVFIGISQFSSMFLGLAKIMGGGGYDGSGLWGKGCRDEGGISGRLLCGKGWVEGRGLWRKGWGEEE